jgi:hypothetical protein
MRYNPCNHIHLHISHSEEFLSFWFQIPYTALILNMLYLAVNFFFWFHHPNNIWGWRALRIVELYYFSWKTHQCPQLFCVIVSLLHVTTLYSPKSVIFNWRNNNRLPLDGPVRTETFQSDRGIPRGLVGMVGGVGLFNPTPLNSEILTKLSRISSSV